MIEVISLKDAKILCENCTDPAKAMIRVGKQKAVVMLCSDCTKTLQGKLFFKMDLL